MSRFLRPSMQHDQSVFCNYAVRNPAKCDLSLVSGPFIWHEEFQRALAGAESRLVQTYPLPNENPDLVAAIAEQERVPTTSVILSSGADSALEVVLNRYLEAGDTFGILSPNFPRFAIVAATIPGVQVKLFTDLEKIPTNAKLVSICTPNNPSTAELPEKALRKAVAANSNTLFCIDGVFDWYGSYELSSLCQDFENVIILKSFSKIGLAGLRLGYAMGHPDLIADLKMGATPFAVPAFIQNIGLEIARSFHRIGELHEMVESQFAPLAATLGGRIIRHSPVPFYLLHTPKGSTRAARLLAEADIAIVDCDHCPDIPKRHLRVSIGNEEQNRYLASAVQRLGV